MVSLLIEVLMPTGLPGLMKLLMKMSLGMVQVEQLHAPLNLAMTVPFLELAGHPSFPV